jgi:hypothetical protein
MVQVNQTSGKSTQQSTQQGSSSDAAFQAKIKQWKAAGSGCLLAEDNPCKLPRPETRKEEDAYLQIAVQTLGKGKQYPVLTLKDAQKFDDEFFGMRNSPPFVDSAFDQTSSDKRDAKDACRLLEKMGKTCENKQQETIGWKEFAAYMGDHSAATDTTSLPVLERAKKDLAGNGNAEKAIDLKISWLSLAGAARASDVNALKSGSSDQLVATMKTNEAALEKNAGELKALFDNNPGLQATVDAAIAKAKTEINQEKK